jgi:predicted CXXCH cytochrome family protein
MINMKKYLIALVLGLVLVLALATTIALADNGPHGGFAANTDACAGCHRLHSARVGSNELLQASDPEALCLSCHGNSGTGADTNVEYGVYRGSTEGTNGASLFAGGFVKALMATAWSGKVTADAAYNATSADVTSMHNYGATGTIWGSGANNSTNGSMTLECTSCHDPHGTAGYTNATTKTTVCNPTLAASSPSTEACTVKIASYRLLRWQPSGSDGFTAPGTNVNWSGGAYPTNGTTTGWTVPDNFATLGTEWYTIGTTGAFAAGDYNAGNANNVYNLKNASASEATTYIPAAINVAFFCAQCHDRYFNNSRLRNNTDSSGYCGTPGTATATLPSYPDADGVAPWIHPVDSARCIPVVDSLNALVSWGDSGSSGDTTYMYRHASGDIRLSMDGTTAAGGGTSLSRACSACHVAHGTSALADPQPSNGVDASAIGVGSLAGGSVLMRMDGRTICLRCHASTVNFVVGP